MSLFGKTAAGGWRKPSYAALAFIAVMAISAAIFIAIMGQSDDSSLTHIDMVHIFISAILFIAAAILVSIHIIKSQHFGGAALSAAPASSAAMQDGLTGCLQRKAIYSHLRQAISEAQKNKLSMAMVYISIDNLQKINNHFGHVQGDQIIKKTADIIKIARCNPTCSAWAAANFAFSITPKAIMVCLQKNWQQSLLKKPHGILHRIA